MKENGNRTMDCEKKKKHVRRTMWGGDKCALSGPTAFGGAWDRRWVQILLFVSTGIRNTLLRLANTMKAYR